MEDPNNLKGFIEPLIDYDYYLLTVYRCSRRCLADIMYAILNTNAEICSSLPFNQRFMLLQPEYVSADILLKIPHRVLPHQSNCHQNNLDFFKIKGTEIKKYAPEIKLN